MYFSLQLCRIVHVCGVSLKQSIREIQEPEPPEQVLDRKVSMAFNAVQLIHVLNLVKILLFCNDFHDLLD